MLANSRMNFKRDARSTFKSTTIEINRSTNFFPRRRTESLSLSRVALVGATQSRNANVIEIQTRNSKYRRPFPLPSSLSSSIATRTILLIGLTLKIYRRYRGRLLDRQSNSIKPRQSKHSAIYLVPDFSGHYAPSRLEPAIFLPLHSGHGQ